MRYFIIVSLFSALLVDVPSRQAFAQSCLDANDQAGLDDCGLQTLKTADRALNTTYTALMAKISPDGQASLKAAEKAWIAYRDKQCDFETAGSADGSVHPMVLALCAADLTQAQTARLKYQLNCQEGDSSCGGQ